ncbi:hypothetical protein T09_12590 [Trichinella sp. T9]|nr:hypothetical protein T09_12590 [Trichinella sp. T9]
MPTSLYQHHHHPGKLPPVHNLLSYISYLCLTMLSMPTQLTKTLNVYLNTEFQNKITENEICGKQAETGKQQQDGAVKDKEL